MGWMERTRADVSGVNSGFLHKKTARLTSGGKNFIFQGLSTFGSVLGIGCGFFGFGFLLGFQGSGSGFFRIGLGSFRWIWIMPWFSEVWNLGFLGMDLWVL